jgi:catechol 2,3-dioxygenase-like lactoylglutathione lyase family enzyme
MPVLNHHIVDARDAEAAALFFSDILGLEQPMKLGHFTVLKVSGDTTLDFVDTEDRIVPRHYAFLVTEVEFDEIFSRIVARQLPYWSDPQHRDQNNINQWDDGRGVYFNDPNGHRLEILTRPYGSGGTHAQHPHPLISPPVEHKTPYDRTH